MSFNLFRCREGTRESWPKLLQPVSCFVRAVIQFAVRRTPPKVNRCRPAIAAFSASSMTSSPISASGPASTRMRANAVWPRASARSDAPMPQRIANFAKVATLAGPATPTCTGQSMPCVALRRDPSQDRSCLEAELGHQRHVKPAPFAPVPPWPAAPRPAFSCRSPGGLRDSRRMTRARCHGARPRRSPANQGWRGTVPTGLSSPPISRMRSTPASTRARAAGNRWPG